LASWNSILTKHTATDQLSPKQLVAHRGLQAAYPENTALSVSKAIDAGALFVEIDIQLSLDKQPMVFHDSGLKRVSGRHGMISEISCHELSQIPAYEPARFGNQFISETISPLVKVADIIAQHPNVTLFVELKEQSIAAFGAEVMLNSVCNILQPIRDRAVLISFDYDIIFAARLAAWPQVGAVLRKWRDIDSEKITQIAGDYTFVDYKLIPVDENLTRLNTKLVAYEVGTRELAQKLAHCGVDLLETFDISTLLE